MDESKSKGYILAATATQPGAQAAVDRVLQGLLLPGQRRLHFKAERDSRRRELLSRMTLLETRTTVYVTNAKDDKVGRALTLATLIQDSVEATVAGLVLEHDESVVAAAKRFVRERLVALNARGALRYDHAQPEHCPVLWISDAVAWCMQAGGDWKRRATPLIESVRLL